MRIAVTGASGNVGTSVLRALGDDSQVEEIVGLARRRPELPTPKVRWVAADVVADELVEHFHGAQAVIHLAWLIQPSRDRSMTRAANVDGSARVFRAAAWATWKLRLQPTPPGWLDMALAVPLMDTTRARTELGWEPTHSAGDALLELLDGLRQGAGLPTPPLDPDTTAPARSGEVRTSVGT